MIINCHDMRNLSKGFSQVWLVKMAGVVMKICVGNILLVSSCPNGVLSVFFPAHCKPLFQGRYFLPYPIGIDLASKPKLTMKASTFVMLLHNVFPHKPNTAKPGSLIRAHIQREIITRGCNETPACLMSASNQEFIPRATEMRCDRIRPFDRAFIFHPDIYIIFVECPSLMIVDICRFQLPWIRRQISALVNVYRRWLGCISNQ